MEASPAASQQPEAAASGPPEPPSRPPPRKDGGLGARAALNSLRALSPVVQLVRWSHGSSSTHIPETPRGPPGNSPSQLPCVRAPSNPAPRSGRRAGSFQGRRPPQPEAQTPRAQPQSDGSPQLPCVGERTPPQSRGPRAEAPGAGSPAHRPRPRSEAEAEGASCREMLEVQHHAQRLLAAVFEMTITDEAAASMLDSYPELTWLANCMRRCPLPPGWTAADAGQGRLRYINMGTAKSQDESPLLERFADLGRFMLHWRRSPSSAADVVAALGAKHAHDLEEAVRARRVWKGPHVDPDTGIEFWHCPATGRSAWGDPGMASEFLARVAERLQRAIPLQGPGSPEGTVQPPARPPGEAGPACAGTLERQAVRQMMAEIASNALASAEGRPRPSDRHAGQPGTAARAAAGSTPEPVREDSAGEEAEAKRLGTREAEARRPDTGVSRGPRVAAGEALLREADSYVRPECRRRRLDSSERLEPIDVHAGSPQPPSTPPRPATAEAATVQSEGERPSSRPRSRRGVEAKPGEAKSTEAKPAEAKPTEAVHLEATPPAARPVATRPVEAKPAEARPTEAPALAAQETSSGAGLAGQLSRRSAGHPPRPAVQVSAGPEGEADRQDSPDQPELVAAAMGATAMGATMGGTIMGASIASHLGSTALVGQMCAGAIAAAIDDALINGEDRSATGSVEDDSNDILPPAHSSSAGHAGEEDGENVEPVSPSLMSVCRPRSPEAEGESPPRPDSPSILVLDDGPRWAPSKPLPGPSTPPRPQTPPRGSTGRGVRPVLLGAPEPLSARARCSANEPPLSARLKGGRRSRRASTGPDCGGA